MTRGVTGEPAPCLLAAGRRIGIDENGLGARLGPLVVTAVQARVSRDAARWLAGTAVTELDGDLQDSKVLVSHADSRIGEAWARVLATALAPNGVAPGSPAELFERLSLEGSGPLSACCPAAARAQCWSPHGERFLANDALIARVEGRVRQLVAHGVQIERVASSVICTAQLNRSRADGHSRFVVDLHAMERLVLHLGEAAGEEIVAVCGKVGGIGDYPRYFGPLAGRPHAVLAAERHHAGYHFPGLGAVHFVMDADAQDPFVMLASLVGKSVRELLMARIARAYAGHEAAARELPSGYHDPKTARFVARVEPIRRLRAVPDTCFERDR